MNKEQIIASFQSILAKLNELLNNVKKMNESLQKLYIAAKNSLGKEMSPKDVASDDLACVESFCHVYKLAFGQYPDGRLMLSTIDLYGFLSTSPLFEKTDTPEPGTIVLAVTEGNMHGHVFVAGKYGLMSNDSRNGLWMENYTLEGAKTYYEDMLGLTIHYFNHK